MGKRIRDGRTKERFYQIFLGIKYRCKVGGSRSKDYGDRGIKCERKNYDDFKKDMYESYLLHVEKYGEKNTSIDRIDVNGNYNKDNCRWATPFVQTNNRRITKMVNIDGTIYTFRDLCIKYNLPYIKTYHYVFSTGHSLKQLLIEHGYEVKK